MRKLALAALVLSLGACTDRGVTEVLSTAVGAYTLRTVDGSAPPFLYLEATGYKDEILSGTVALNAGGRFTDETLHRRTRGDVVTTSVLAVHGTWSVRSGVVRFLPSPGSGSGRPYTMRLDGTRLTLVEAGVTSVFER